jgi:glycerophosphoryl diester phosphodiesterase
LRAYAHTVARKPDGVELDARVTADGVAIVAHDPVTVTGGARRRIDSIRFADLPAGAFLRLDDLMAGLGDFGGRIYVEIKDFSERAVHSILDTLEPCRDKVWFVSLPWKHKALRHVLKRWQAARTNLISITPALSPLRRAHDAGFSAVTFGWSGFNTFRMLEPMGGHVAPTTLAGDRPPS